MGVGAIEVPEHQEDDSRENLGAAHRPWQREIQACRHRLEYTVGDNTRWTHQLQHGWRVLQQVAQGSDSMSPLPSRLQVAHPSSTASTMQSHRRDATTAVATC
jgi:hypothetical protein